MRHLPVVGGLFRDTLLGRVQRHEYEQDGGDAKGRFGPLWQALLTRGRYHGGRRPSSDDSFHSPTVIPPIGTGQNEYHEALPSSSNVEVRCDCTFADDGHLTVVGLHDTGPRSCKIPVRWLNLNSQVCKERERSRCCGCAKPILWGCQKTYCFLFLSFLIFPFFFFFLSFVLSLSISFSASYFPSSPSSFLSFFLSSSPFVCFCFRENEPPPPLPPNICYIQLHQI